VSAATPKKADGWFKECGPHSSVVISSRVRLARNVLNASFPSLNKQTDLKNVLDTVLKVAEAHPLFKKGSIQRMPDLSALDRQVLMERHIISKELAANDRFGGLLLDETERTPVMINEEDHVRMAALGPGLGLEEAWERLTELDDWMGKRLPWSYHTSFGFLTACPTNCGTGLRASTLLHLPALVMTNEIHNILQGLSRLGLAARGFYGEGSKALGDIFQISNASSLGKNEKSLIRLVQQITLRLVKHETEARQRIHETPWRVKTEDAVFRSLGILQNARQIGFEEAMTLLSRLRLGLHLGLDLGVSLSTLNSLTILTQPAHLTRAEGKDLSIPDRDAARAALLRKNLAR